MVFSFWKRCKLLHLAQSSPKMATSLLAHAVPAAIQPVPVIDGSRLKFVPPLAVE